MTLIGGLVIYGYAGLTHQPTEVFAGRHVGKACEQTIVQHIFYFDRHCWANKNCGQAVIDPGVFTWLIRNSGIYSCAATTTADA